MYKHILVAVDGSDSSNLALNEAIRLASEQHATIRLVHVVDLIPTYTDLETPSQVVRYQEALREIGQKVLSDCRASTDKSGIQADVQLHIIETPGEHIYDAIAEEAVRWPADLIVIGTHGRRGIRRFILGSVAEGVIRVATKPVLLVRGA
jgi:nucleotide-binding universal stress UspA family protein